MKDTQNFDKQNKNINELRGKILRFEGIGSWEWDIEKNNLELSEGAYQIIEANKEDLNHNKHPLMNFFHTKSEEDFQWLLNEIIE